MGMMDKMVMQKFYREAGDAPERLPWHQEDPGRLLTAAVRERHGRGRALDVGCGAGVFSIWLAQQGMEVVGLDLLREANALACSLARKKGAQVDFVCHDLLVSPRAALRSRLRFGLSPLPRRRNPRRVQASASSMACSRWRLRSWTLGKRHAFDWRPIGPKRRSEQAIRSAFAPDFELIDSEVKDFSAPLPFGPTVRGAGYWFKRRLEATA
jgi:SAM-dependent methyltransferase